jgi:hypothetical protein
MQRKAQKDELRRSFLRRHKSVFEPFALSGALRRMSQSLVKKPPPCAAARKRYSSWSSYSSCSSASSSSASSDEENGSSDRDADSEIDIQQEQKELVEQPRGTEGGSMRDFQLADLTFSVRMHGRNLGMILAEEMRLVSRGVLLLSLTRFATASPLWLRYCMLDSCLTFTTLQRGSTRTCHYRGRRSK